MTRFFLTITLAAAVLLSTTLAHAATEAELEARLDDLVVMMTGSFSSAAQAAADEEYFEITLHMAPIWEHRPGVRWLYVEQAVATSPDKPYRQRMYKVTACPDGTFLSAVYTMPDPLRFVGAWQDPSLLDGLAPFDLSLRPGCTVVLDVAKDAAGVFGSTVDDCCQSSLYGATYATSEVIIFEDSISSWDRGFDADGNHVWGAEKGPYIFDRL